MVSKSNHMVAGDSMARNYMLTPSERKVIIELAEKGPLTRYHFTLGGKRCRGGKQALMSNATWPKILKRLGPDGLNLIHFLNPRGRPRMGKRMRKPIWLTEAGVFAALTLNIPRERLLRHVKQFYPKNQTIQCFVEASQYLNSDALKYAYAKVMDKKQPPDVKDCLMIMMLHVEFEHSEALLKLLQKYPEIKAKAEEEAEKFKQFAEALKSLQT